MQLLGADPAAASAMKMALGGLAKGLCALFAEMALLAGKHEILPEMLRATARIYPGMYAVVERMLPTYALHAARRATEMAQVEQTLRSAGVDPLVMQAVRRVHESWAAAAPGPDDPNAEWPLASLIRQLSANDPAGRKPPRMQDR